MPRSTIGLIGQGCYRIDGGDASAPRGRRASMPTCVIRAGPCLRVAAFSSDAVEVRFVIVTEQVTGQDVKQGEQGMTTEDTLPRGEGGNTLVLTLLWRDAIFTAQRLASMTGDGARCAALPAPSAA